MTHESVGNPSPEGVYKPLTRYPTGSARELWTITWPLMLTTASSYLMILCDRLILARYSSNAMNAAATTGITFATFQYGFMAIVLIGEVFVGQYNGKKRYQLIGPSVWQMIWFSLFSSFVFFPVGKFFSEIFVAKEFESFGVPYFRILMYFGPVFCLVGALSTFFVGRGITKIITVVTVLGAVTNVLLDILLIFGIEGYIPEMGSTGAALATGIAQLLECCILAIVFLSKRNRLQYGTNNTRFKKNLFFKALKIGFPSGLMHVIEIGSYALLYQLLASVGNAYITTYVIGQNFYLLFCFVTEAFHKGITAIVSNLIGAQNYAPIHKTLRAAFKVALFVIVIGGVIMLCYPDLLIQFFLKENQSGLTNEALQSMIRSSLFFFWLVLISDVALWIFSGVLTASGDTKFLMWVTTIGTWVGFVFPCLLFIKVLHYDPALMWEIMPLYMFFMLIAYWVRYKAKPWEKVKVT